MRSSGTPLIVLGMAVTLIYGAGVAVCMSESAIDWDSDQGQHVSGYPDLIGDEIGFDPDLPTNWNIDRIEEESVPGPIDLNSPLGLPSNSPDKPREE